MATDRLFTLHPVPYVWSYTLPGRYRVLRDEIFGRKLLRSLTHNYFRFKPIVVGPLVCTSVSDDRSPERQRRRWWRNGFNGSSLK